MNFAFMAGGLRIGRDASDKPIRKETTVIFRALLALNGGMRYGLGDWARYYPHRHGLTDSRIGVRNKRTGEVYWHERYQIEDAAQAFNAGELFLLKA